MTPLITEIKKKTQIMTCSVHHKNPEIIAFGDKIDFKCCCEAFESKLLEVSKKTLEQHAAKTLETMLKDAFKGSKHIKFR